MTENLLKTKKEIIQKLKQAEDELSELRKTIKNNETNLWLNTEFKSMGCTNEDTRKAYVNRFLTDLKFNESLKRNEINMLRRELGLVDDKIRLFS